MSTSNEKTCFVICPIGAEGSDARNRSNTLFEYILTPILENEKGYKLKRADLVYSAGSITTQIVNDIVNADLAIVDITDHNPNVMYELGIRHAINKPVIHMMSRNVDIPFDLKDFRTITYGARVDEAKIASDQLRGQINAIENNEWHPLPAFSLALEKSEQVSAADYVKTVSDLSLSLSENVERIEHIAHRMTLALRNVDSVPSTQKPTTEDPMATIMNHVLRMGMDDPQGLMNFLGQMQKFGDATKKEEK